MKKINALCMLAAAYLVVSCASSAKLQTMQVSEYVVKLPEHARQTKSNVTIEVEVLKPSEIYNHPELFAFKIKRFPDSHVNLSTRSMYPVSAQGKRWCYTFGFGEKFLTAMRVKVTNNTPHILRLKDSRIYFVVEGEDPMAAVTTLGNASLVGVTTIEGKVRYLPKSYVERDQSLVHWLTVFEADWDRNRKRGLLSLTLKHPLGVAALVVEQNRKHYQLISELSAEILPDFSREGILFFPAIVSRQEAKLMFYDITTRTDAAGNPIEKTRFEFPLVNQRITMWYDRAQKRWQTGEPPVSSAEPK